MKFTLPSLIVLGGLAGFIYYPKPVLGQSSKEVGILQRDIFELQHRIDELKTGQGDRAAQLETLLKQVMEANAKLTVETQALQEKLRSNQIEQQTRVFEPMAVVKQGMEDVSGNVAAVQANLNTMRSRQEKMESTLNDLSAAIRLLATQAVPPPAPVVTTSAADAASLLFASAERDRLSGQYEFALGKFNEIAQTYPDSLEAPMAVYKMGEIYARNAQPEDAVKAYDRVLEQFGENPMRKDAQFMKAEQLASLGRKADAAREFESFAKQYPGDANVAAAMARAKELKAPAPRTKQTTRAKGK